jgi:hypothetical protein
MMHGLNIEQVFGGKNVSEARGFAGTVQAERPS